MKPCNFNFNSGNKKFLINGIDAMNSANMCENANSCGQNFPKITVKKLHVLKKCSLEICNFIKNGVRSTNWSKIRLLIYQFAFCCLKGKYFGSSVCCRLFKCFNSPNEKWLYVILESPLRILIITTFVSTWTF